MFGGVFERVFRRGGLKSVWGGCLKGEFESGQVFMGGG